MSDAPPAEKVSRFGLPVNWKGEGQEAQGSAEVIAPSDREVKHFGEQMPWPTCGQCLHFDRESGQKEMVRQDFLRRLVNDEGWKLHHLGAPLDHLGLCGESNGQMVTTTISRADNCPGFKRRPRGHLRVVK